MIRNKTLNPYYITVEHCDGTLNHCYGMLNNFERTVPHCDSGSFPGPPLWETGTL